MNPGSKVKQSRWCVKEVNNEKMDQFLMKACSNAAIFQLNFPIH